MKLVYLSLVCALILFLPGCFLQKYVQQVDCDYEVQTTNGTTPASLVLCDTRLDFDETESRIIVVSVDDEEPMKWKWLGLHSGNQTLHAAFGRPAVADDPQVPFNLGKIADGSLEVGQFIGICGQGRDSVGVVPTWAVAWDGPEMDVAPCGGS